MGTKLGQWSKTFQISINLKHCFQLLHLSPWIITDFIIYVNKGDKVNMGFLILMFGASLVAQMVKNLPAMQERPGSGRSGVGNGNPLQYFCMEKSMDRAVLRATVYGVCMSEFF